MSPRSTLVIGAAGLVVAFGNPSVASAQRAETVVRGWARDSAGAAIPRAAIELSSEADSIEKAAALTDDTGAFVLRVRSSRGRWLLSAHRLGYAPVALVASLDSADRAWLITMRPRAFVLDPIRAAAKRIHTVEPRRDPASSGTATTSSILLRFPGDPGDLVNAAQHLNPSVIPVVGPDGTVTGLSIAGQPPTATGVVVDGATAGSLNLPSEAVGSVRTFTSTYEVSRGQFGSGQISAQTRSGTDTWQGAVGQYGTLPIAGASRIGPGSTVLWAPRQGTLSSGGGGPLIPGWLYGYGAMDLSYSESRPPSVVDADSRSANLFGVNPDSVRRLESVAENAGLGQLLHPSASVAHSTTVNGVARFDMPLTMTHSATFRVDGSSARSTTAGPFSLSGPVARRSSDAAGVYFSLTSLAQSYLNEARVYYHRSSTRGMPSTATPQAAVRVSSGLVGSPATTNVLTIGENGSVFGRATNDALEITNDLSLVSSRLAGKVVAGFALRREDANQRRGLNPNGTFSFPDISAFEAGRPSVFIRSLTDPSQAAAATDYAAAYIGSMSWIGNVGITAGVRGELARYGGRDTVAARALALAPDARALHNDASLSPRIGFRVVPSRAISIYGGTGDFRAPLPAATLAGPFGENGSTSALILSCVGSSAPRPNWSAYVAAAESVPNACDDGASPFASNAAGTTVFGGDFRAPHAWRSSIGSLVGLGPLTSLTLEASLATSNSQPIVVDRNLAAVPSWSLQDEAGRPVFVRSSDIDATTGSIAPRGARRDATIGTVRELDADGRLRIAQMSLRWGGLLPGLGSSTFGSIGYAFTSARVEGTSFAALGAQSRPTAGDPNERGWFDSRFASRHVWQLTLDHIVSTSLSATLVARVRSAARFTPLVLGDVNGDGSFNDPAFIFDPATADTAVARGLRDLFARGGRGAECLARQLGRIAAVGSCQSGWSRSVDASFFYAPRRMKGFTLSVRAMNVLAGVDRLLHGASARGWGETPLVDDNLLVLRGFDDIRRAYHYDVNSNFGQPRRDVSASPPFALQVRVRLTFGSDPARPQRTTITGADSPSASRRAQLEATLRNAIVNTPAAVLTLYDARSIELTTTQIIRLHEAMDSLQSGIDANVAALVNLLDDPAGYQNDKDAQARHRALEREARELIDRGLRSAREILGAVRWSELPDTLQSPSRVIPTGVIHRGTSGP